MRRPSDIIALSRLPGRRTLAGSYRLSCKRELTCPGPLQDLGSLLAPEAPHRRTALAFCEQLAKQQRKTRLRGLMAYRLDAEIP